jgi:hypothetical protein
MEVGCRHGDVRMLPCARTRRCRPCHVRGTPLHETARPSGFAFRHFGTSLMVHKTLAVHSVRRMNIYVDGFGWQDESR